MSTHESNKIQIDMAEMPVNDSEMIRRWNNEDEYNGNTRALSQQNSEAKASG